MLCLGLSMLPDCGAVMTPVFGSTCQCDLCIALVPERENSTIKPPAEGFEPKALKGVV